MLKDYTLHQVWKKTNYRANVCKIRYYLSVNQSVCLSVSSDLFSNLSFWQSSEWFSVHTAIHSPMNWRKIWVSLDPLQKITRCSFMFHQTSTFQGQTANFFMALLGIEGVEGIFIFFQPVSNVKKQQQQLSHLNLEGFYWVVT